MDHPDFIAGSFDLNFIQDNPELLLNLPGTLSAQKGTLGQRYDHIEGYLKYIANLAVNGHPKSLGANDALVRIIDNCDIPAPDKNEIEAILSKKKKVRLIGGRFFGNKVQRHWQRPSEITKMYL